MLVDTSVTKQLRGSQGAKKKATFCSCCEVQEVRLEENFRERGDTQGVGLRGKP